MQTPGPIIEELSDDSDDDDELSMWLSCQKNARCGKAWSNLFAGGRPGNRRGASNKADGDRRCSTAGAAFEESRKPLKEAEHAALYAPADAVTSKNRLCNHTDIPAYAGSGLLPDPSAFLQLSLVVPDSGFHSACHTCDCSCVASPPATDVTFLCSLTWLCSSQRYHCCTYGRCFLFVGVK